MRINDEVEGGFVSSCASCMRAMAGPLPPRLSRLQPVTPITLAACDACGIRSSAAQRCSVEAAGEGYHWGGRMGSVVLQVFRLMQCTNEQWQILH